LNGDLYFARRRKQTLAVKGCEEILNEKDEDFNTSVASKEHINFRYYKCTIDDQQL
jgi:hypothetical protein